jgi:hypothetical protein
MTPREILKAVRFKTWALVIHSGGKISYLDASRAAAKQVAAEQRARKRALQGSPPTSDGITVRNARATLLAKLAEISKRLKATAGLEGPHSRLSGPRIRKHVLDPVGLVAATKPPALIGTVSETPPITEPEPQLIGGVFVNTPTAERIPDSEYAPSLRWGDTATDNWRKSIELNERIQREKQERSKWIG